MTGVEQCTEMGAVLSVQDLLEAVLALMGLKPESVSDGDSLALLGIDSMQLMEVRVLCTPASTLFSLSSPSLLGIDSMPLTDVTQSHNAALLAIPISTAVLVNGNNPALKSKACNCEGRHLSVLEHHRTL